MLKRTQTVYNFDNWRYPLLKTNRKVYNDKVMSEISEYVTKPTTSASKPESQIDDINNMAFKVLQSGDEKSFIKQVLQIHNGNSCN